MSSLSPREVQEIARANASGRAPVLFVHGLWLLAESWDAWRGLFEAAGYATLAPGWPDDPESVEEARRRPDVLARKRVEQVTDHVAGVVGHLEERPAIVGHSFGGLVAQQLAGMGLASATVAIDPAPFRGVLPLPFSALRSAWPVLKNPANAGRAVALTWPEFRYAWANALEEGEARALHDRFSVPGPGAPLFQAATANLDPWTFVKVDTASAARGPLLVVSGERDRTVPRAMAFAAYRRQLRNPGLTTFVEMRGRGHSLTIDSGWREVAELALAFVREHHPTPHEEAVRGDGGWGGRPDDHAPAP